MWLSHDLQFSKPRRAVCLRYSCRYCVKPSVIKHGLPGNGIKSHSSLVCREYGLWTSVVKEMNTKWEAPSPFLSVLLPLVIFFSKVGLALSPIIILPLKRRIQQRGNSNDFSQSFGCKNNRGRQWGFCRFLLSVNMTCNLESFVTNSSSLYVSGRC
jgi:hypothetical protein